MPTPWLNASVRRVVALRTDLSCRHELLLADRIGARAVSCETRGKNRYKRYLAHCPVGGEDVALWLAEVGWVFPYRDCKGEVIREAVDRAKAAQLGIWSGDVKMPWKWRKANCK